MNHTVITVENISKKYRIGLKEQRPDSLAGYIRSVLSSPFRNFKEIYNLNTFKRTDSDGKDIIWALRDISFEIKEGEILGIIGQNGAGKSTLLKILSRITTPTSGKMTIFGRVASLLEVGTGFHPDLTGRENIYLNGTILGMKKKEIDHKFDHIVDFSGVEQFIDTPIKRYSSGMQVRLAFAVAAHLDPEILIIDEVLAVGDTLFQQKCLDKMTDISKSGKTILFVSHNLTSVKALCAKAIVLKDGVMAFSGTVSDAINYHISGLKLSGDEIELNNIDRKQGEKQIVFNKVIFDKNVLNYGDTIRFKVILTSTGTIKKFEDLSLGVSVCDKNNVVIYHIGNQFINKSFLHDNDNRCYMVSIENNLRPGTYSMTLFLSTNNHLQHNAIQDWLTDIIEFKVEDGNPYSCKNSAIIQGCVFPEFDIRQE